MKQNIVFVGVSWGKDRKNRLVGGAWRNCRQSRAEFLHRKPHHPTQRKQLMIKQGLALFAVEWFLDTWAAALEVYIHAPRKLFWGATVPVPVDTGA